MVKADARCDYYADLELPPEATADEIKKQFKKLALKYHPDRNPGRETEFISKFQAIQAANEVLTDPTQRAKYDADRIRSGLFYPYASPTRPNVPPRSPATHFPPPPPRPPPPTATKTSFPSSSAGTNRYSDYAKAGTSYPRTHTNADDNYTKANAFKAWEQMRHGTGPPPTSRVPPRASRPTFTSRPMPSESKDDATPPRRSAYEQFQDFQSPNVPRMSRANTTRAPKKTAFAAGTFPGEEAPSPKKPTFNDMPRSERPARSNPGFAMPPPSGHRKPDASHSFQPHAGANASFSNADRLSTPYATAGGEKTYFSSHGLGRPTSTERRGSAERYDTDPISRDPSHTRHPSTPTERQHHSASPKMRTPKQRVSVSSSSSSTSSSDEAPNLTGRPFATRRKPVRKPAEGQRQFMQRPSVKVETAVDPATAPSGQAAFKNSWTDASRKEQTTDSARTDQPEGFLQHRLKRESLRMDPNQRRGSATHTTTTATQPQHSIPRHKSWNENYGQPQGGQVPRSDSRPRTDSRTNKEPMYGKPGYIPSPSIPSRTWSEPWPFMSPGTPSKSSGRFPYWAIPSSLPPMRQSGSQEAAESYELFHSTNAPSRDIFVDDADLTPKFSFKFPAYDDKQTHNGAPPLRSQSSESINTNFSPSRWDGKFTSGKEYFAPPPSAKSDATNERVNPISARPVPPPPPPRQDGPQVSRSAPTTSIPSISTHHPPPPTPVSLSKEEWAQHFKPPSWAYPPPKSNSPVRGLNRKRPTRSSTKVPSKRPQPASVSADVDGSGHDIGTASVQSISSPTSDDESAMDIDPASTPPSGLSSGEHKTSAQADRAVNADRPKSGGPPVPPRTNGHRTTEGNHIYVSDLKKVAPFAPNAEGLKDLNDLTTTLPFESQPSNRPPTLAKPQLLQLPDPPKAPMAPPESSWGRYIAQMKVYMLEWNEFNSKMLAHFTERQSNIGNTLTGDWMSTQGSQGFRQYMQGVEEDFRVREHWDVSWEKHRECMKKLGVVRDQTYSRNSGP